MDLIQAVAAGLVGFPVGSYMNRLIVREPGYVIVDPGDLPADADPRLLDELEPAPVLDRDVPILAVLRPSTWWRRWFPVTEVVTAASFALTVSQLGSGSLTVAVLFLVAALVTMSAVDFRVLRLPDRVNFPSMAIGLGLIVAVSIYQGVPAAIFGALAGGATYTGMLYLAHVTYPRAMGWGDVKLGWLMGFYLGWLGWSDGALVEQYLYVLRFVLYGFGLGSICGFVMGSAYALIRRSFRAVYPFGPSLALGCLAIVVLSRQLR